MFCFDKLKILKNIFSPVRKSIKDRLGPVGDESPSGGRRSREKSANKDTSSKRDAIRDRLGRKVS